MADPLAATVRPPLSPAEARRTLGVLRQPAVFLDMTSDWPACSWSADQLAASLGDILIRFRLGRKDETHSKRYKF